MTWLYQLLRLFHIMKEPIIPNRFVPINPGSSNDQIISIINKNFAELDAEANTKVYYSSANQVALNEGQLPGGLGSGFLLRDTVGNPAIAMYVDNNGKPILKVAKTSQNAIVATDDQLIFNSNRNILQVLTSGSLVQALPNSGGTISAGTSLNYTVTFANPTAKVPVVVCYFQMNQSISPGGIPFITGNIQGLPYTSLGAGGSGPVASIFYDVSPTSITFYYNQGLATTYSPAPVITFYYTVSLQTIN